MRQLQQYMAYVLHRTGRDFSLFLIGELLTLLCIGVWNVALSWWIATNGGARDLAIYGVALSGSSIFFTFVPSPLGDRYNKRTVILYSRTALLVSGIALASMCSSNHYNLVHIVWVVLAGSAAMAVVLPACAAVPADVVKIEHLPLALSLQKSVQSIGRTIGPALAGGMLAFADMSISFWVMVFLGGLSALSTLPVSKLGVHHLTMKSPKSWHKDLHAGLRAKWEILIERYWSLLSLAFFSAFLPATGMLLPLLVRHHGLTGGWYGLIDVGYAVGMVFGFVWLTQRLNQRVGRVIAGVIGLSFTGVSIAAAGLVAAPPLLVVAFFGAGAGFAVHNLNGQTHRTLAIPAPYRVRLMAINVMSYQLASAIGAAITGWLLAAHITPETLYVAYGAIILVVGVSFAWIPGYTHFMSLHHEKADCFYGKQRPDLFPE